MKIYIDARIQNIGGVKTYVDNFTKTLISLDKENEYHILMDPSNVIDLPESKNVHIEIIKTSNKLYWLFFNNILLKRTLSEGNYVIYHSLKQIAALNSTVSRIITFHTSAIFSFSDYWTPATRFYWRRAYLAAAKRFDSLILVSEADKDELLKHTKIPTSKIHVIYLAPSPDFKKIHDSADLNSVRVKFRLPEKFILFVGVLYPFKNIETIIKAYSALRKKFPGLEEKLVIVGRKGWYFDSIFSLVSEYNLQDHVFFTGQIDQNLPEIYNLTTLFVFPSLYEACPLPPLEAMASGTPIIISKNGGLPEIAGNAGLYLDNCLDYNQLSDLMENILMSPELKSELSRKGLEQVKKFSWEKCVRQTLDIYNDLAKKSR